MPSATTSPFALLRLLPFAFPLVFVAAAATGALALLYAAVAMHLAIIAAENTIGRRLAAAPVPLRRGGSSRFEDGCLSAWVLAHAAALAAALSLSVTSGTTARQVFALGAIFGYSINVFSASVGHELMHRERPLARLCARLLYAAMLYPHFPAVHLSSHHRWAGSTRDCQTPRPGQSIHAYLVQAFAGGWRIALGRRASVLDPTLSRRIGAAALALIALIAAGAWRPALFLIVQGAFAFIVVETLNYIQHFRPADPPARAGGGPPPGPTSLANQDLNFVSRCALLNLPLHAAHHADAHVRYPTLSPVAGAPSYSWGYWTSFWLAWAPPVWNYLHRV